MPGKLTHQGQQVLLHSFSGKGAFSPFEYHAAAAASCRPSKPIQGAALATCTVPVHLEDALMGHQGARGAPEATMLAPRRTLSDVLKERTNDSLSLSRSSSNSESELGATHASKQEIRGINNGLLESLPRAADTTEAKGEQSKGSGMTRSKMKALESLALPQLHTAVRIALEIRRRRAGRESAASKAQQPRQELPDDDSGDTSSPTAKQAAQTLTSIMASRGTDAVCEEGQNDSVADEGNKDDSSNNNMDLPQMQGNFASRKRKRDFQPSPSRLRRMSSLATEMSCNTTDDNPVSSAPAAVIANNPTPEPTQQERQQAPDMRRVAIANSAAIRVFRAARQARMRSPSFCDDATSMPRPSAAVMPGASSKPPQQEPTRRQADINRVWEAAVRVFQASHAQQQQQQGAHGSDRASPMQNNAPRPGDLSWTESMKVEHRHLFKAIAEARRHSRAGCL